MAMTGGGTIVCGVVDSDEGRDAAELACALGSRLDLRVVLVSVVEGPDGAEESVGGRQRQWSAQQALAECTRDFGNGAETRLLLGPRAEGIAQVAAEEGADLIVLGSRPGRLGRGRLRCTLAAELEATTPVPVLVAPPSTRRRSEQRLALAAVGSGS
jgi:nucleotide-binding universal stress UspA family protein